MMKTNKLTKTLAFPIATGAAALGVLAGSVLTATSASAASLSWSDFVGGTPLLEGDKQVTFKSTTFNPADIPANTFVSLIETAPAEYTVAIMVVGAMIEAGGSFTYQIDILNPKFHFTGVQVDSDVSSGYGDVTTLFAEPSITLTSTNGWPDPSAPGSFAPVPGSLNLLTVTNTLTPNSGGGLMSSSNKFLQGTKVPEPGTILGLLTVSGLGLVSRFKKQK
ncbi:MAG: PEP-CTERM sorting domain-containing protein [Microcystis sp.]